MKYIALLVTLWVASVHAALLNLRVKRVIDVSSSHPFAKTTVVMQNTGEQPESFFYLAFKCADENRLSDVWFTEKKRSAEKLHPLDMEATSEIPGLDSCCRGYKVSFPTPLAPGAEATIEVRTDGNGVLTPVPAEIKHDSPQYMQYDESSYFFTPYDTKSMRTVLVLNSKEVSDKTGIIEPSRQSKRRLEMGPYDDVPPYSHNPISVRFKNDRGFLVARVAEKHFYISHRGSISIREEYQVTNAAAKCERDASNMDHSSSCQSGTVLRDVMLSLPVDATHIGYMDVLGNATSLTVRDISRGKRPVQLGLRRPIAGGEEAHFWITYDVPLSNYLKSNGYEHDIQLPIFSSMKADLLSEKVKVRVLLPFGSYGHSLVDHPSLKFNMKEPIERKSFTEFGRPAISLGLGPIRSQTKHFEVLQVRYKYHMVTMWIVPLFVGGLALFLFAGLLACVRNGLSTKKDGANEKLKSS